MKKEVNDIKKEYGVVKVGATSEEGKPIESIVKKRLISQLIMTKPSKMRRMFWWVFPLQLLKKDLNL